MKTELQQMRDKINKKTELIIREEDILSELVTIAHKLNLCADISDLGLQRQINRLAHSTDKLTWTRISKEPLSLEFIEYFKDKISWPAVALYNPNIEELMQRYGDKLPKAQIAMRKK